MLPEVSPDGPRKLDGRPKLKEILLVEDNISDVDLILMVLERNHVANRVIVVQDGAEALDYLFQEGEFSQRKEGNPAVILLDLKMPGVDGMEVLRRVKSDPKLRAIPVIILTSSREERDMVEGYRLGANSYVIKPVLFSEFVEAVSHLGVFWTRINETPPASDG